MAYICRLLHQPGTLSLEKCVKFGVPTGPLLRNLKARKDVTLESGIVVRSIDVREPDDPGPTFIVIDCPSPEYIPSLIENGKFKRHPKYADNESNLGYIVVHFCPASVTNHPSYKDWIN
ncbi:JhI-1 [Trypoxylus dichotomus]